MKDVLEELGEMVRRPAWTLMVHPGDRQSLAQETPRGLEKQNHIYEVEWSAPSADKREERKQKLRPWSVVRTIPGF